MTHSGDCFQQSIYRQVKYNGSIKHRSHLIGGTLSTKGGLVFLGEGNGNFNAIDAASGAIDFGKLILMLA